ncbi:hypothetical protein V1515DRAFT_580915 [Lipomyces mesembrius]
MQFPLIAAIALTLVCLCTANQQQPARNFGGNYGANRARRDESGAGNSGPESYGNGWHDSTPHIGICGGGAGGLKALNYFSQFPDLNVVLFNKGPADYPGLHSDLGATLYTGAPIEREIRSLPQEFKNLDGGISQIDHSALGGNANDMGCVANRGSEEFFNNTWPVGMQGPEMLAAFKQDENHFCYDPVWREALGYTLDSCTKNHGRGGPVDIAPQTPGSLSEQNVDLAAYLSTLPGYGSMTDYLAWGITKRGISQEVNIRRLLTPGNLQSPKTRVDAYTAWFNASVQARRNIHVLTNVECVRVFDSRGDGHFDTVEYLANGTQLKTQRFLGGIILSAGVLASPKIAELSGVGNPAILAALGIPLKVNNTQVGENVVSHMGVISAYQLKRPCFHNLTNGPNNEFEWWTDSGMQGPKPEVLSDGQHEILGCFGVKSLEGSANGLTGFHMLTEFLIGKNQSNSDLISFESELLNPKTRGSVHIASRNPNVEVAYDAGWTLANVLGNGDAFRLLANFWQLRIIALGNNSWANKHISQELWPGTEYTTRLSLEGYNPGDLVPPFFMDYNTYADLRWLMDNVHSLYHIGSSMAIGKALNMDGSIIGVKSGLFVYDNSAQPVLVNGNPTLTLWAMGNIVLPKMLDTIRSNIFLLAINR